MTMLADHPTWPVKKKKSTDDGCINDTYAPPPFPPQPTNQGTQAQQAPVGKPCPFCGGVMSSQYVLPSSVSVFGNVAAQPAQIEIGCHNGQCTVGPKLRCHPGSVAVAIGLWNTRSP